MAPAPAKGKAVRLGVIGAVLGIEPVHHRAEGPALQLVMGSHLAYQQGGVHGVLIPDMHAGEIAAALLKAHEEAFRLPGGHELFITSPMYLNPVSTRRISTPQCSAPGCQGGGHNAHHSHRIPGHGALGGALDGRYSPAAGHPAHCR